MQCVRNVRVVQSAILAVAVSAALTIGAGSAHAWTYKVLYAFSGGSDGYEPNGVHLIRDKGGNLYGTTSFGGTGDCGSPGCGVIFKIHADGRYEVLYTFSGRKDGGRPVGGLVRDQNGNMYGTTQYSGNLDCNDGYGCGVVFKFGADGKYKVLHSFSGSDGAAPSAGLIRDAHTGDLYGTTLSGGDNHAGTVFKLAKDGTYNLLHSFNGAEEGGYPQSDLTKDADRNLYGVTTYRGDPVCGCGTIFKIAPDGETTILYTFTKKKVGEPLGGLISDKAGNLYGTVRGYINKRTGAVFRFSPDGTLTSLYRFGGDPDGAGPAGTLLRTGVGTIYGTTTYGGDNDWGTVFELDPDGTETVLHSFGGGAFPSSGVVEDASGNLYGTTALDGSGYGTVFELVK